jgi:glucose/arabinose dehydrogenase
VLDTAEQHKIKVSIVAAGSSIPGAWPWLPTASMLITERPGASAAAAQDGTLDPTPISGVPMVKAQRLSGLMDVVLHPRFAENHLVYLTYNKGRAVDGMMATRSRAGVSRHGADGREGAVRRRAVVGRRRRSASRIVFGRDGMLYMTTGSGGGANFARGRRRTSTRARSCGCATTARAADNPFVKDPSFKPEIYSWGHRNSLALIVHPVTASCGTARTVPTAATRSTSSRPGRITAGRW